jgi:hypothetical protein
MKKITIKPIFLGFRVLSVLAFSLLVLPTIALADAGTNVIFGGSNYSYGNYPYSYNSNSYGYNSNPYAYSNVPYNYNQQPPVYAPNNTAVASNAPMVVNYTPTAEPTHSVAKTTPAPTTSPSDSATGLAANAIFGSNTFLPSGLIQWVLFAILILLIVILVRKIFGHEAKYHATPLKHE